MASEDSAEFDRGDHRPPRDDLAGMSPYSNHLCLERRVCPNCRYYFDVDKDSDDVFCSDACRHRHEAGVLMADGGGECSSCGGHVIDAYELPGGDVVHASDVPFSSGPIVAKVLLGAAIAYSVVALAADMEVDTDV